jgi:hypothetical protein
MRQRPNRITPKINYADLIKPLSEKAETQVSWVGGYIANVQKQESIPVSPTPTPSITPTQTVTPTPTLTPTPSSTPPPIQNIEFNGTFKNEDNLSLFTFTGLTASTTGLVVLGLGYKKITGALGITITGVTINDVEATILAQETSSFQVGSCIVSANITATTYDVEIRLDGAVDSMGGGHYVLNNLVNSTPYFTNATRGSGVVGFVVSATTPNNIMIAAGAEEYSGGVLLLNGITQDYNFIFSVGGFPGTKWIGGGEPKESSGDYTITLSNTSQRKTISVVAWQ